MTTSCPQPGLVARHRAFHRTVANGVLLGYMPLDLPQRRGPDDAPSFLYSRDYEKQVEHWRRGDSREILGSLWGGNFSLRRELYQRAEQFMPSPRLEYNEDLDLGLRLIALGAEATFDDRAAGLHQQRRDFDGFVRECAVRGAAAADLEARWGTLPGQLRPLISISAEYARVPAWVQRTIAARDEPGALEFGLRAAYRVFGRLHVWRGQDAVARLLRRALAMRGYRTPPRWRPRRSPSARPAWSVRSDAGPAATARGAPARRPRGGPRRSGPRRRRMPRP